jgi:hypothetical protein
LAEIAYLYENKGNMSIEMKTLDTVMGERSDDVFYHIFGDYCDKIAIERTTLADPGVDYAKIGVTEQRSLYRDMEKAFNVCPLFFYHIKMQANGKFDFCCRNIGISEKELAINKISLVEVWNSEFRYQVMCKLLLEDFEGVTEHCRNCHAKATRSFEADYLDPYADEIYKKLIKSRG